MLDGGKSLGMLAIWARQLACSHGEQERVLRSAYPNCVGAPDFSAQDDKRIGKAKMARLKSGPDTRRYFSLMDFSKVS